MNSQTSDHRDLTPQQIALVEKTEEILGAGGLSAEALSTLIVGFHRRLREELHPAESPVETGAGDEEKVSPPGDKRNRLGGLTISQSDRFHDALCHLGIIHEVLMQSYDDHFSGISSLLLYPKEVFEQLEREFDAADQAIQVEKVEKEEATVC